LPRAFSPGSSAALPRPLRDRRRLTVPGWEPYSAAAMASPPHIVVLGGGPAGLAVGWSARRRGLPFTLLEASDRVGGNCTTLQTGDFRYDSGAHRLHDRDPEITAELRRLLGDDLRRIDVPSQIWDEGRLIRFPLSSAELLAHLGPLCFGRAALEVLRARIGGGGPPQNFEAFALRQYGRVIAERFLLDYSTKLWGAPAAELSPQIAGQRLSGLDLRAFISESVLGRSKAHVEGSFYYPRLGIGQISERLADAGGRDAIRTDVPITRLLHDGRAIRAVEIAGRERRDAEVVVSSLPLDLTLRILDPPPPPEVLRLTRDIHYRQVRLAVLFVNRPSVTQAATVYFPHRRFSFTRISEPRNRSPEMAPAGATSLLAEIPCHEDDDLWRADERAVIDAVRAQVEAVGWVRPGEVLGGAAHRLANAYPILDTRCASAVERIHRYLAGFANLWLVGRSGRFVYGWIHDMVRMGLETVAEIAAGSHVG
jgi:protoporphyrinogen oxidase